jgi:hypothetical protein
MCDVVSSELVGKMHQQYVMSLVLSGGRVCHTFNMNVRVVEKLH